MEETSDALCGQSLASIIVRPYGVLGQQLTLQKKFIDVAPFPGSIEGCVFVDPAGLHHVIPPGGPSNAGGAAGAIYKAIGIDKEKFFPPDVIEGVKATGDAKYHVYKKILGNGGSMDVHVIHTVGPDLRKDANPAEAPGVPFTREQAVDAIAASYKNTLLEFIACGLNTLRLLPVSGGIFAGAFMPEMPRLTRDALLAALKQLSPLHHEQLRSKTLELCVFMEKEIAGFVESSQEEGGTAAGGEGLFSLGAPREPSEFVRGVPTRPYGVLGQQMTLDKKFVDVAPFPSAIPGCVFVDPAGLHHIQPPGGPSKAGGAAGAIYKAIGIDQEEAFSADVVESVKATSDAKYHLYSLSNGKPIHVIHSVGPDLRKDFDLLNAPGVPFTEQQALAALGTTYKNIFKQFLVCGQPSLRLLPMSGGIFAGGFLDTMPRLTWEALQVGFSQLGVGEKLGLEARNVELCVFAEKELPLFHAAGFAPDAARGDGRLVYSTYPEAAEEAARVEIAAMQGALEEVAKLWKQAGQVTKKAVMVPWRKSPPPPPPPPAAAAAAAAAAEEVEVEEEEGTGSWSFAAPISPAMSLLHVRKLVEAKASGSVSSSMGMFGLRSTYSKRESSSSVEKHKVAAAAEAEASDERPSESPEHGEFAVPLSDSMVLFGVNAVK